MARDRLYVSAVGDITAEELGPLLDRLLGALPAEGAPMPEETEVALDGGITVVEFDTPQSVARFGQEGIERHDEDFFAAYVLNQILGGRSLTSRLSREIREERGLTYGISTSLLPRDLAELIAGQVATANPRMAETIGLVREEWRRISEEGVTAEELEDAKTYLTGAYPLRFDGNGPIADILVGMQMEDLPTSYVTTRNERVEALTLEEVNRVAAELYRPEDLHFVVVGQPEGLDATN